MKKDALPLTSDRYITYEELKKHSSYSDAWISLDGTVYDITNFIPIHPFGDTFRGNLGTECGGLFSSTHLNTDVANLIHSDDFLQRHNIVTIGRLDVSRDHLCRDSNDPYLDRIVYKKTSDDEFWQELKGAVRSYLKEKGESTHYTFREGILYIAYYLVIYVLLSCLTWIEGSFLAAALLGGHMVCAAAHISHAATHYGFTRSRLLNCLAMHGFDLLGMSGLVWQIAHQTHHNQPHSSIDHQTNAYDYVGIRIHKYMKHEAHHRYQYIYFWLVISAYLMSTIFATTTWLFVNNTFVRHKHELVAHLAARAIMLSQMIYSGFLHGYWTAAGLVLMYSLSCSQAAFILLFNNYEDTHKLLGETEDVSGFHDRLSWAEVQVRTSSNWYPTNWFLAFIEFHYGYFNYHIEHHLFPGLKPSLLKKISPLVRCICRKHGIPYVSTRFMTVQMSLQEHISKLGLPDESDMKEH